MKHLYFLLLLLSVKGFAQSEQVIRIDSFPKAGIVLNEGWKWHAGDNPDWAKEGYDDSAWESIDPTQDIDNLPAVKKAGRGWLRLKLRVDSSLRNKIVGIMVNQVVASEFYLNGELVTSYGTYNSNIQKVKAYNPSGAPHAPSKNTHIRLGQQSIVTLAIRFALEPKIWYVNYFGDKNHFVKIRLNKADLMAENSIETRGYFDVAYLEYLKAGFFLALALLHLFFYFNFISSKANFYFGVYCLCCCCFFIVQPINFQYVHFVKNRSFLFIVSWLLSCGTYLFLIQAIYSLFAIKQKFIFSLIILYFIFCFFLFLNNYHLTALLSHVILFLAPIEGFRVSNIAFRRNKPGAFLISLGALVFSVFMLAYMVVPYFIESIVIQIIARHIFFNIGVLSMPISITLFLAREFAQNARSLAQKLTEVEVLSAQTLAQEQEKQQILATQNETLEHQVTERTAQLQASQAQLIQREKLASLGELTAGIAHEIQNPLNFVNNFAEVSAEMALEMKEEMDKGETEGAKSIADDLILNLQKINHHGKRASSIVKNMLEHSRTSTGEKALTNLNTLLDECLRLSYHGMRAQEKDFQAEYSLDLEADLPEVVVVAQDIGRVLLNLFNNAFYEVSQKRRQLPAETAYTPKVSASTRKTEQGIEIRISDNGSGIPEAIRDKIFQPFFTTKPTGEGTGLGLSLAYDIITKGHGGSLALDAQPSEGCGFIITLPL